MLNLDSTKKQIQTVRIKFKRNSKYEDNNYEISQIYFSTHIPNPICTSCITKKV